jgi:hypothetical protein
MLGRMEARWLIPRRLSRALVAVALGLGMVASSAAAQSSFSADVSCRWGARECNPPARGLAAQFRALRDHGDLLGFRMGAAPDVNMSKHWQGVQRLTPGQGRFLAISRSGKSVSFVVVSMASRDGSGERYRSNRIASHSAAKRPPASDRVVTVVSSDPGFDHSGGIQSVGSFLAVGLEEGSHSRVAFWYVADPQHPRRVGTLSHATGLEGAGTVSIARLRDGRYLLIVGGTNANTLDFYVSRGGTSLQTPRFDHTATWKESQLVGGDREFGNYQNLGLVADAGGRLFLIGTHRNEAGGFGKDFADLFRLEGSPHSPRIRKVASRHLFCGFPGGAQCDLDAAGGVYVTPSGRLLLYGTEHDNDGPGGSVKAEEFRPAPHRASCTDINDAWVELYDDTGFDGDRSVMIDFLDRGLRNYENYDFVEGFEDKTSAARWCLPSGWRHRLFRDKGGCGGRTVDLMGTGRPESDPKFGDNSGLVRKFNDEVSCSRWLAPPGQPQPTPTPTPTPQPQPQPPPPGGRPDLIISQFTLSEFTVKNQGTAAAGPFAVTLTGVGDFAFSGLGAGATATRSYSVACEAVHEATADSNSQVDESDETNNVASFTAIC